jgi:hypothetical protein
MTHYRISMGVAAAALLALPFQPAARADTGAKIVEEVDFATSCSPAVQHAFKHAVWTLHSFWYPEALKDFTAVTKAEPGCAMGYWGYRDEPLLPAVVSAQPSGLEGGLGGGREGHGGADKDRTREGLHRGDRRLLPRQ